MEISPRMQTLLDHDYRRRACSCGHEYDQRPPTEPGGIAHAQHLDELLKQFDTIEYERGYSAGYAQAYSENDTRN